MIWFFILSSSFRGFLEKLIPICLWRKLFPKSLNLSLIFRSVNMRLSRITDPNLINTPSAVLVITHIFQHLMTKKPTTMRKHSSWTPRLFQDRALQDSRKKRAYQILWPTSIQISIPSLLPWSKKGLRSVSNSMSSTTLVSISYSRKERSWPQA